MISYGLGQALIHSNSLQVLMMHHIAWLGMLIDLIDLF